MKFKLRLLPLVIFAASLTLSLKVGVMWQDMRVSWSAPAVAESKESESESSSPTAKAGADKTTASGASGSGDGKSQGEGSSSSSQFDASTATDTEIELLQKLSERRAELERRERQLTLRQTMLSATERRIDSKVAELSKIKTTIETLLKKHDTQQEAKLKSLVKIYENMKPKDAARIFNRLDLGILLDVVERMRESKTAPIMANMSPARAKSVTAALVKRGTLPRARR
jgi:flagellar motility protein MotE (MotC chaperone)